MELVGYGLFKEWFVRFRFPGFETTPIEESSDERLPRGWTRVGLHDVAEVTFGFPFKSKQFSTLEKGMRVVRIRDIPAGRSSTWTTEDFDERYTVRNGDLLIGMDGIFHTAVWAGGDAALNQRVALLRPLAGRSVRWLLLSILPKIKHLEATITGTTVAHLSARDLRALTVLCPVADLQHRIDALFQPIDEQILCLRLASERLATSRDLLLPRLMSGELSIAAAERQLEAAA